MSAYDINKIRSEFPILNQKVNGKDLIYFDNAATNQKPQSVIDSLSLYYKLDNANIHRGAHCLADRATVAYEETRTVIKEFINAKEVEEVIFTKGTTDGINLVAASYGEYALRENDEVIISTMEHHSNIVPWQRICEKTGAKLRVVPITEQGEIVYEEFLKLLSNKTKIVAIVHASNALGTINDIENIIKDAHKVGAKVLVDGAQSCAHLDIDVQKLDVDFFVSSSHKMYGPTGIGFLYGKRELLEAMPPYQGGGEMIKEVTFEKTTYNDIPFKFEAGTPNIADVTAFKHGIFFIQKYGKEEIAKHELSLLQVATDGLKAIPGVRIIGEAKNKVAVLSFVSENMFHFDMGMMLDARGIAVRTGHHCTQPLMSRLGLGGTVRASFSAYNTLEEVNAFIEAVDYFSNK